MNTVIVVFSTSASTIGPEADCRWGNSWPLLRGVGLFRNSGCGEEFLGREFFAEPKHPDRKKKDRYATE